MSLSALFVGFLKVLERLKALTDCEFVAYLLHLELSIQQELLLPELDAVQLMVLLGLEADANAGSGCSEEGWEGSGLG